MSRSSSIMRPTRVLRTGFVLLVILGRLTSADDPRVSSSTFSNSESTCSLKSIRDSVFAFQDSVCPFDGIDYSFGALGVIEGDESSLQKALSMVHKNTHDYVAVLFYASWCPFSVTFRPSLSVMSSLYSSVPHFAIEESVIRPSILSKYGVHGFPTLFLLNSTMRVRYHGSRNFSSLVAFYGDVTGVNAELVDKASQDGKVDASVHEKGNSREPESCPFSWARSPENLLRHETYLALAVIFVVLRLLYLSYPFVVICSQLAWRRQFLNTRFRNLWEHPLAYMDRAIQLFSSLTEPWKRSNLHGAMNAKAAWASKSLASVSFGEASTSRDGPVN